VRGLTAVGVAGFACAGNRSNPSPRGWIAAFLRPIDCADDPTRESHCHSPLPHGLACSHSSTPLRPYNPCRSVRRGEDE